MTVIERPNNFPVVPPPVPHRAIHPFSALENSTNDTAALIILNTDLSKIPLRSLWKNSIVRVCADGGANRLHDYFPTEEERAQYLPNYITGDCDSLRKDVSDYYSAKGTIIIKQLCQYSTDFMKSMKVSLLHCDGKSGRDALIGPIDDVNGLSGIMQQIQPSSKISIFVAGGIGGRFDQLFHSINQLYTLTSEYPGMEMFLYTQTDVIFLLHKGLNYVKYSSVKSFFNADGIPCCGLLPYGRKVNLNTIGLLFDVEDWESEVGAAVSTSNGVVGVDGFIVNTSDDIVMNIEVDVGN